MSDTATGIALDTGFVRVRAEAKLPDDLVLSEFEQILHHLVVLSEFAQGGGSQRVAPRTPLPGIDPEANDLPLVRVQYGSDFATIFGIVVVAAPTMLIFGKLLDLLASAGLKNEDRLGKREERFWKRQQRASGDISPAIDDLTRIQVEDQLADIFPDASPAQRNRLRGAVLQLGSFRVRLRIERD